MPYIASQKYKLINIFLFSFKAYSMHYLQKTKENYKPYGQPPSWTTFTNASVIWCYSDATISPRKPSDLETKSQKLY